MRFPELLGQPLRRFSNYLKFSYQASLEKFVIHKTLVVHSFGIFFDSRYRIQNMP